MQKSFLPIDYKFEWTEDWYKWDAEAGRTAALKARNAEAKRLKDKGHTVRKFSLRDQLISRGGIGSGKPHIELHMTCFLLNVTFKKMALWA